MCQGIQEEGISGDLGRRRCNNPRVILVGRRKSSCWAGKLEESRLLGTGYQTGRLKGESWQTLAWGAEAGLNTFSMVEPPWQEADAAVHEGLAHEPSVATAAEG